MFIHIKTQNQNITISQIPNPCTNDKHVLSVHKHPNKRNRSENGVINSKNYKNPHLMMSYSLVELASSLHMPIQDQDSNELED